jgi:hypothetical protein
MKCFNDWLRAILFLDIDELPEYQQRYIAKDDFVSFDGTNHFKVPAEVAKMTECIYWSQSFSSPIKCAVNPSVKCSDCLDFERINS